MLLSTFKTCLLALLLAIVLVSCVPAKVWHQDGADDVQRTAALNQCTELAQVDAEPVVLIGLPDFFGAYLNLRTSSLNDITKYYRDLDLKLFERLSEAFIDEVKRIKTANPEEEVDLSLPASLEFAKRLERVMHGQRIYTVSSLNRDGFNQVGFNQVGIVWGLERTLENLMINSTSLVDDPNNLVRPNWNYGNVRQDIERALNSYRNSLNDDIVSKNNQRIEAYNEEIHNQTSQCMLANGWQRVSVEEIQN